MNVTEFKLLGSVGTGGIVPTTTRVIILTAKRAEIVKKQKKVL